MSRKKAKYSFLDEELAEALHNAHQLPSPRPIIEYRALIAWKDGIPYAASTPIKISDDPAEKLSELLRVVLDLPYSGDNPDFAGLSNAEALAVSLARAAADGDESARDALLDRILGRPKQKVESLTLTGDLNDFLDKVAKEEAHQIIDVPAAQSETLEDL